MQLKLAISLKEKLIQQQENQIQGSEQQIQQLSQTIAQTNENQSALLSQNQKLREEKEQLVQLNQQIQATSSQQVQQLKQQIEQQNAVIQVISAENSKIQAENNQFLERSQNLSQPDFQMQQMQPQTLSLSQVDRCETKTQTDVQPEKKIDSRESKMMQLSQVQVQDLKETLEVKNAIIQEQQLELSVKNDKLAEQAVLIGQFKSFSKLTKKDEHDGCLEEQKQLREQLLNAQQELKTVQKQFESS